MGNLSSRFSPSGAVVLERLIGFFAPLCHTASLQYLTHRERYAKTLVSLRLLGCQLGTQLEYTWLPNFFTGRGHHLGTQLGNHWCTQLGYPCWAPNVVTTWVPNRCNVPNLGTQIGYHSDPNLGNNLGCHVGTHLGHTWLLNRFTGLEHHLGTQPEKQPNEPNLGTIWVPSF